MQRNPNQELNGIDGTKCCDTYTPLGHVCSKLEPDNLDWSNNDKEKEDDFCICCTPKGLKCQGHGPDTSD